MFNSLDKRRKVKGSPDPRLVLVPHKAGYTGRRRLLWSLSLLVALAAGFAVGSWQSQQVKDSLQPGEILELIAEKSRLEAELQEFRYLAAHSQHDYDLEQVTVEQVRQENLQKQRRIAELETELALFRSIMAPEDSQRQGLIIEKFELEPLQSSRYRYKIVLIQVEDIRSLIAGEFSAYVIGRSADGTQTLSFSELDQALSEAGKPFRFRYFQSFTGELSLPDGFSPDYVQIVAQTKGRQSVKVERQFEWLRQEG